MAAVAYYRQGLDGEAATDLDEIDGATLNDGDFAFVMTGTTVYHYRLDDSSGAAQSLPNVVLPSGTAGNKRWILQSVQNVQSPAYSNITTSTTLVVGYTYNDSSGTNIHTLPLLSTTSSGEKIKVYLSGTDRTVIINHHASDSSGAEIWTGVAVGDFVELVSTTTAWIVEDHYESHYCRIYVDADESIGGNTSEKIATNFAQAADIGGICNTTTSEVDVPFDAWMDLHWQVSSASASISAEAKIDTIYIFSAGGASGTPYVIPNMPSLSCRVSVDSGDKVELWAFNHYTSTALIRGDAAGDESFATIKLTRRYS